jgi:hypothetical protein
MSPWVHHVTYRQRDGLGLGPSAARTSSLAYSLADNPPPDFVLCVDRDLKPTTTPSTNYTQSNQLVVLLDIFRVETR